MAYVGDNQNVRAWLRSRAPRPDLARQLLRLLTYLEVTGRFQVMDAYVRTYHNLTADRISRCTAEEFPGVAAAAGFEVCELEDAWREALGACRESRTPVLLGWDPEDHGIAARLREERIAHNLERPACAAVVHLRELGATTCDFGVVWGRIGGTWGAPESTAAGALGGRGVAEAAGAAERTNVAAASLGPDGSGREALQRAQEAVALGAERVVLEGPEQQPQGKAVAALQVAGYIVHTHSFATTAFGEALYRKRWAAVAWRGVAGADRVEEALAALSLPIAPRAGRAWGGGPRRTAPSGRGRSGLS